jgi:hypothetical protein
MNISLPMSAPIRQVLRRLIGTASALDGQVSEHPPSAQRQQEAYDTVRNLNEHLERLSDYLANRKPIEKQESENLHPEERGDAWEPPVVSN